MSLRNKLLNKIQVEGRVTYGALVQITLEEGYKVGTAERRLRELAEEELVYPVFATSKRNTKYISAYLSLTRKEEPKRPEVQVITRDGMPIAVLS